jgi:hypothetical protein
MTFERNAKLVPGGAACAGKASARKKWPPRTTHMPPVRLLQLVLGLLFNLPAQADMPAFLEQHCMKCHDADTRKGGLNLEALKADYSDPEGFARWVKVFDRIDSGEMPPRKEKRPAPTEVKAVTATLSKALTESERARLKEKGSTGMRRMTRAEYEKNEEFAFCSVAANRARGIVAGRAKGRIAFEGPEHGAIFPMADRVRRQLLGHCSRGYGFSSHPMSICLPSCRQNSQFH